MDVTMEMYDWWTDHQTGKEGLSSVGMIFGGQCATKTGSEGTPMLHVNSWTSTQDVCANN